MRPTRQTGSFAGTSAGTTRPGRTGGCSVTAPAAPSSTASPGPTSSDTRSSSTEHHPMTRSLPTTGPGDDAKRPCRSTAPPCGSTEPSTDAARSARPRSSPPQTAHKPHATGSTGWPPLARRSTSSGPQPARTPLNPVSSTCTATPPASHQGLLEPDARKRASPVLKGARRRKAPGLPDERDYRGLDIPSDRDAREALVAVDDQDRPAAGLVGRRDDRRVNHRPREDACHLPCCWTPAVDVDRR